MFRRFLLIATTMAIAASTVPAQGLGVMRRGETLTSNPRAYSAWIQREIREDLVDLYSATNEILAAMNEPDRRTLKSVAKNPEKLVKLSRSLWSNVQHRKPTRERPKPPQTVAPRSLAEARTDVEAVRLLVRNIAEDLLEQQRSREIDARGAIETIEKIERLEMLGYQLRADLSAYR